MAILLKHRDAPVPSLATWWPDAPPQLDDLFRRMLAKQREDRVQTMSEVVAELESMAVQLGSGGLSASDATADVPALSSASTSTTQAPSLTVELAPPAAPATVLLVEPSRVQASIIKGYLEEHALEVVGVASSGQDAIAAVHSLRPRAVISAMYLPDIKGVALAEQIRSQIQVDAPGFVLITSEADDAASGELSKLNRVQTLVKPFTASQLVETLNQVTGRSAATGAKAKVDRSQLRVLIVDDSTTARMHIRTVLQGLGFQQFLEEPDGAHAIVAAARENCHLIVTDYNMPLMDGRALVSYLKQNPATSAIPIVMVTTETDPRVLDPVRKLGVVAVIEKAYPAAFVGPLLDSMF
jgi:two-component system chemotaxis response regulator CheY